MLKPNPHRVLSRRKFLQVAGLGVSLGPHAAQEITQHIEVDNSPMLASSHVGRDFVYGTWFYSPQDIPLDRFRALIGGIANRDRFNLIRIFPPWDYYNPRRDEYRFDELESLLSVCDEFDVRVLMTVMLESAPYWLEEEHPEARFVDAAGKTIHLQSNGAHFTGGFPGLCLDWMPVRDAAAKFMVELVRLSIKHSSFYAYDIWNEPAMVDYEQDWHVEWPMSQRLYCYCDATIGEFRQWLQRRYGSLDRLNAAWIRGYSRWETVSPPRNSTGTSADWLDWLHFIQDRTTEYLKFRVDTVRAIDSAHLIETHVAYAPAVRPVAVRGIQNWRLAQEVDTYGCSFYPDFWTGQSIDQMAAQLEIIRSCANGKSFWVTEMQGGQVGFGSVRVGGQVRARNIRTNSWLAVSTGAKGIVYYSYLDEGTGGEASHYGLVGRDGKPTERLEEAVKVNRLIQARSDLINGYRPKAEVAILFDQDNPLLTFSATGKEDPSVQSVGGYYKAIWRMDLWADCIEPASINHYKVVVAPWHLIAKKETTDKLREFVEQGGILILETAFARFDEKFQPNEVIPGNGLHAIFGYREVESVAIENSKLPIGAFDHPPIGDHAYQADIVFSEPASIRIKAHTYLTSIEVLSARPIAMCNRKVVAAMKAIKKGKIYYVGTNLGASIFAGDAGGIELVRGIITESVQPTVTCSGELRPRLIEYSGRALLVVFNDSDHDLAQTISLLKGYSHAKNIRTGERVEILNGELHVSVSFKDTSVFDLG